MCYKNFVSIRSLTAKLHIFRFWKSNISSRKLASNQMGANW